MVKMLHSRVASLPKFKLLTSTLGSRWRPGISALQNSNSMQQYSTSGQQDKSRAWRLLLLGGGVTLVGLGGTIGYAYYDSSFKKKLENTVPYSSTVFTFFNFDKEKSSPPLPKPMYVLARAERMPVITKVKKPALEEVPLAKVPKPEIEVVTKPPALSSSPVKETTGSVTSSSTSPLPQDVGKSGTMTSLNVPNPGAGLMGGRQPKSQDPPKKLSGPLDPEEEAAAVERKKFCECVAVLQDKVSKHVLSAAALHNKAMEAIREHFEYAQKAMDEATVDQPSGQSETWKVAEEAAKKRASSIDEAEAARQTAREMTDKLEEVLNKAKKSKVMAGDPILSEVERCLHESRNQLDEAAKKVMGARCTLEGLEEYKNKVQNELSSFQREIHILIPEVKPGDPSKDLTPTELHIGLLHALKRLSAKTKEVEKLKALEQQRIKGVLEKHTTDARKEADERATKEHTRKLKRLEENYQHKISQMKEQFEADLQTQMRRQAAAHAEHLQDVLGVQEKQRERKFVHELSQEVENQRNLYQGKIAELMGQVEGIKSSMKGYDIQWSQKGSYLAPKQASGQDAPLPREH
ncbi:unnamed protein product [Darwinula stevensoni]|uniref:MICOS complex subunit MIC60 n=1 Tax=Darwinula stevensoni TaxID=69355 RepID=A0A7R9AB24_9CRUS|nr:unnamed protein product [Darwinula stevensoni]CAG0899008.1 unnamed protein product [Darwinula stevensoni]